METSQLETRINTLNQEGIALTMQAPPRYDDALIKHTEALQIAREGKLNPDYRAFSSANIAYALRRKAEPRETVLKLLDDSFQENLTSMKTWAADSRQESYAGTARLLEEMTLVHKSSNATDGLTVARGNIHMAIDLYLVAAGNVPAEIITLPQINSRLWRTLGVASTVATDLSKHFPRERKAYLREAVSYAQQELDARLSAGETSGRDVANAYHTVAAAQTELASRDKNMYLAAKENLQRGKQLALDAGYLMPFSVMSLREAWLEYKRSPLNKKVIGNLVQTVLDQQQQESMHWDKAVKNGLHPKMMKLAECLGGVYQAQINELYSAR